jgi:hypothetical protein
MSAEGNLGGGVVRRAGGVERGGHEAGGRGREAPSVCAVQRHDADAQPVARVHPRVDGRRSRAQQVPVQSEQNQNQNRILYIYITHFTFIHELWRVLNKLDQVIPQKSYRKSIVNIILNYLVIYYLAK